MSKFVGSFEIYHGEDGLDDFSGRLRDLGYKKFGIIIDRNLVMNTGYIACKQFLERSFELEFVHSPQLSSEPTYSDLDREFKCISNFEVDFIVAFGGGSVLDLAKGLSILFNNPPPSITYRGMNKVKNQGVPLAVFPSTAGTGTEMTWTASFIDLDTSTKLGINGNHMFPKYSVLEPTLLVDAPFKIILSSALDALVHAIEAVTSRNSTDFSKSLGSASINRIVNVLPKVASNQNDLASLSLLQIAASEAGLAMLNSSGGPSSGISYPLGVHFNVPHGYAGGVLLPYVIEENIRLGCNAYSSILGQNSNVENDFLRVIENLYEVVAAPKGFQKWNFRSIGDVDQITSLTLLERQANLDLNPVIFNEQSVRNVLLKCIA